MLINKFLEFHFYTVLIILTRWQLPDEISRWFLHSLFVNWIFVNKFWKTPQDLKKRPPSWFYYLQILWKFGWELGVWCVYYGPLLPFHFHHLYKLSASQTSQLEKLSPLWSTITIPNWQSRRREARQEENRWLRGARSRMKIVLVWKVFWWTLSRHTWVKNNFQSWRSSLENCQK